MYIEVRSSNVSDKKLIDGQEVGEGAGNEDEVGEEDEVLRVLVRHDPAHPARLPADVAAMFVSFNKKKKKNQLISQNQMIVLPDLTCVVVAKLYIVHNWWSS